MTLDLARFARYAFRFERAFVTDRWDAVRRCFRDDAVYVVSGGPPFEGETRGADRIVELFQRMVDTFDRRFDRRVPRLVGWPRARGHDVVLRWTVRYVIGSADAILSGQSTATFEGGAIAHLEDTMVREECVRAWELCQQLGRPIAS